MNFILMTMRSGDIARHSSISVSKAGLGVSSKHRTSPYLKYHDIFEHKLFSYSFALSITTQPHAKLHFAVVTHVAFVALSCHMQNFVVIVLEMRAKRNFH